MLFNENRLLADDSHEITYLIFFEKWERCLKNLSSAAVVIGALRVKFHIQKKFDLKGYNIFPVPSGKTVRNI